MANAIAQAEGFNVAGSIAQRNNNPGNIGGASNSYATLDEGWNALYNQINLMFSGPSIYSPSMTLAEVGNKYANGDPNWAINVAATLGVTPDTTLTDLESQYGGL